MPFETTHVNKERERAMDERRSRPAHTLAPRVFALCLALGAVVPAAAAGQVGDNRRLVNPNLASRDDLLALPGMTEARVETALENRPYLGTLPFHRAMGLSGEEAESLYGRLFIPLDLNSATEEEILLIPGVGDRMLHEFLEYRPYRGLAEFRREIGKYVDDEELARLESYVFVPIDLNSASEDAIRSIPGVGDRMLHEFLEYRPYESIERFRREIGKYVDDREVARLERYVTVR